MGLVLGARFSIRGNQAAMNHKECTKPYNYRIVFNILYTRYPQMENDSFGGCFLFEEKEKAN